MLQVGLSHLYGLLRSGELDSFYSGRVRRVTVQSIENYITRQLAAELPPPIGGFKRKAPDASAP